MSLIGLVESNAAVEAARLYAKTANMQFNEGQIMINGLNLKPGHFVLDLGCGTGSLTLLIARIVAPGHVFGVDPDSARIEEACRLQKAEGIENVTFINAGVQQLESVLGEQKVDAIFSNYVIHWIKDKKSAFQSMVNLLKPNGKIAIQTGTGRSKVMADIAELLYPHVNLSFYHEKPEFYLSLAEELGLECDEVNQDPTYWYYDTLDEFLLSLNGLYHGAAPREYNDEQQQLINQIVGLERPLKIHYPNTRYRFVLKNK